MAFLNEKKTFLSKLDKSKKGSLDEKIIPLLSTINSKPQYYTTSSCSGRITLFTTSGKKNQSDWLKVSHSLIDQQFFQLESSTSLVWLRLEPFILHIACENLAAANNMLDLIRGLYKKSCLLSVSNKIIVEVRGQRVSGNAAILRPQAALQRQSNLAGTIPQ